MATYPPRGLTPWDLELKAYIEDLVGDEGVSAQVEDGPLTRAALESFLLPRSEYNADVSWTEVSGKPTTFPPSSHSHGIADLPVGTSSTTVAAGNHTHTPASIGAAPATHTHTKSQITDFAHTHTVADLPTGTTGSTVALGNHTHTPASIGAATSDHTHTPASIGAASASHTHTAAEVGAAAASHTHGIADLPTGTTSTTVALGNHTHTPASIGAAPTSHTHTKSQITDFAHTHAIADLPTGTTSTTVALGNHTHTPASIGAAAASHSHPFSDLIGGIAESQLPDRLRSTGVVDNADDAVLPGWYTAGTTATNTPVAGTTWLLFNHVPSTGWVVQRAINVTAAGVSTGTDTATYQRRKGSTTWGAWYRLRSSEIELDGRYALTGHTHTPASIGAAAASHSHLIADLPTGTGSDQVALGNHTHTPASIGAAAASHTHTKSQITDFAHTHAIADLPTGTTGTTVALGNHTHTPASIGAAAASHSHGVGDLTATGTPSATTYLRGDGTWSTPDGGAAYSVPSQAEAEAGTATTARVFTAERVNQAIQALAPVKVADLAGKANTSHAHGIADLPTGTTSTTVALGNHTHTPASIGAAPTSHTHTKSQITDFAHTHAVADLPVGTTSSTVAAGDHTHTPASIGAASASHTHTKSQITDFAHTHAIADLPTGTTSTTVALGNHTHTPASIGAAAASHTHGIADLPTGTTSTTVALGNHTHTPASIGAAATSHTHTKSQITDFAHTHAIGDLPTGTGSDQVALGNHTHTPASIGAAAATHSHTYTDLPMSAAPSQVVAEAGTETTERVFTSQRVRQNVAAYSYSKAQVDAAVAAAAAAAGANVTGAQVHRSVRDSSYTYASTLASHYGTTSGAAIIPALGFTIVGDNKWYAIEFLGALSSSVANNVMGVWFPVNGSMAAAPGGVALSGISAPQTNRTVTLTGGFQFFAASGTNYAITVGVGVVSSSATAGIAASALSPMWLRAVRCT